MLLDADEQHAKNRQLSVWMERLKHVCHDAEDVLKEAQYAALWQQVVDTHGSFKTKVQTSFHTPILNSVLRCFIKSKRSGRD